MVERSLERGLAAIVVGGVVWLVAWSVLQRAAEASPLVERTAKARQLLLGSIVLPAAGFAVALLWLLLRGLLGEQLDPNTLSSALKYFSTTLILLMMAATHALLLQADLRIRVLPARTPLVQVLVAPGAEGAFRALQRCCDRPIELLGQLSVLEELPGRVELPLLQRSISMLGTVEEEGCDTLLVLVWPDGGSLLRYNGAPLKGDFGELSSTL